MVDRQSVVAGRGNPAREGAEASDFSNRRDKRRAHRVGRAERGRRVGGGGAVGDASLPLLRRQVGSVGRPHRRPQGPQAAHPQGGDHHPRRPSQERPLRHRRRRRPAEAAAALSKLRARGTQGGDGQERHCYWGRICQWDY